MWIRQDSVPAEYIYLQETADSGGARRWLRLAKAQHTGHVVATERNRSMGFAGPRVIANTIKQELPDGFQTAEFMLKHGFVDRIVNRRDLRREIARLIDYCGK